MSGKRITLVAVAIAAVATCAVFFLTPEWWDDRSPEVAEPVACDTCTARHQSLTRLRAIRANDATEGE